MEKPGRRPPAFLLLGKTRCIFQRQSKFIGVGLFAFRAGLRSLTKTRRQMQNSATKSPCDFWQSPGRGVGDAALTQGEYSKALLRVNAGGAFVFRVFIDYNASAKEEAP